MLSCIELPSADRAIVEDAKIRDYLLSPSHPIGRFKARSFGAAGYRQNAWQRLWDDLPPLAVVLDVSASEDQRQGQRFVGQGELPRAIGRPVPVVKVWLIPSEGSAPHLITVYLGSAA